MAACVSLVIRPHGGLPPGFSFEVVSVAQKEPFPRSASLATARSKSVAAHRGDGRRPLWRVAVAMSERPRRHQSSRKPPTCKPSTGNVTRKHRGLPRRRKGRETHRRTRCGTPFTPRWNTCVALVLEQLQQDFFRCTQRCRNKMEGFVLGGTVALLESVRCHTGATAKEFNDAKKYGRHRAPLLAAEHAM